MQQARHGFQAGRDRLKAGLEAAGLVTLPSAATYFLSVDLAASELEMDDVTFCERLIEEAVGGDDTGLLLLRARSGDDGGALRFLQAGRSARRGDRPDRGMDPRAQRLSGNIRRAVD